MIHEVNVRVKVSNTFGGISCSFWFKNPITKEDSLISENRRGGESNMEFVERIRKYINTNSFAKRIKERTIVDVKEYDKKNKLKMDLSDVKKELNGLTFSVKIDMD